MKFYKLSGAPRLIGLVPSCISWQEETVLQAVVAADFSFGMFEYLSIAVLLTDNSFCLCNYVPENTIGSP